MKEKKQKQTKLKEEVKMIEAVSEVFSFKKDNPNADSEKILRHISKFVKKYPNRETKRAMIAAASKALSIFEQYNFLSEKEVIKRIMPELREILEKID